MKILLYFFILTLLSFNELSYADDHLDAKRACQEFALKQLKTPATSQFEPLEKVAAVPSENNKWDGMKDVWESIGWVDSQNSFGALIRTEYMCTVQKKQDGKWNLIDWYWFKQTL